MSHIDRHLAGIPIGLAQPLLGGADNQRQVSADKFTAIAVRHAGGLFEAEKGPDRLVRYAKRAHFAFDPDVDQRVAADGSYRIILHRAFLARWMAHAAAA